MASPRHDLPSHPAFAVGELLLFAGGTLGFIWWLGPLGSIPLDALFFATMFGFTALSHYLHGDSLADIGLRLDNVRACTRLAAPATAVLAAAVVGLGLYLGSIRPDWRHLAIGLSTYPFWALAQQYAVQSIVLLRVQDVGLRGRPAALITAALFATAHMPNPGLVVMVFVSGWVWCEIFQRHPNLLVLALSHGWLGTLVFVALPAIVTGRLQIGPNYLAHFG